jgi:hypothetical protein
MTANMGRGRGRILLGLSVVEGDLAVVFRLRLVLLAALAFLRTGYAISLSLGRVSRGRLLLVGLAEMALQYLDS